jgi:hypothetical protein
MVSSAIIEIMLQRTKCSAGRPNDISNVSAYVLLFAA